MSGQLALGIGEQTVVAAAVWRHRRDIALGQDPGRDLVEQRLEEMMRRTVDDRDVAWRSAEPAGGEQSREACADDHHVMAVCRHGSRSTPGSEADNPGACTAGPCRG